MLLKPFRNAILCHSRLKECSQWIALVFMVMLVVAVEVGVAAVDTQSAGEYRARRNALLQMLPDSTGAVFLQAGPVRMREWDTPYKYRQDSNFYYLTGIDKEDTALLLVKQGVEVDGKKVTEILFLPERNPAAERWLGERIGREEAISVYGFAAAVENGQKQAMLSAALAAAGTLYIADYDPAFLYDTVSDTRFWIEKDAKKALKEKHPGLKIKSVVGLIAGLRTIKSAAEIVTMQQVIDLTCESLREAIAKARPDLYEYELEALIDYGFRARGADEVAFPTIVGSGPNSTRPHYWENRRKIQSGEVVVLDVGASLRHYAADVTRTIPINGKFTPEQREIYDIVYRAQEAAIATAQPGAKLNAVHRAAKQVIDAAGYGEFFIHATSHGLGLDTHDPGDYEVLRAGMIITVEPGIYIPANTPNKNEKYWNIGVRIEDDILITATGNRLLSTGVPRTRPEIEKLVKSKKYTR